MRNLQQQQKHKTFSKTPELAEALEIILSLLKGIQDRNESKFIILQFKKLRPRMMKELSMIKQLDWRINEGLQTFSGVILLHIFQFHFCFLCLLKYTTEIHAHILE